MSNKMLIDATHPEETRVVVTRGNRVEEFDFESASKRQLRGNIYLAKVIRVEPSLQAAFVDYGGNRHGFLAFAEIHPDYYQIPISDRQALLEDESKRDEDEEEEERRPRRSRRRRNDRHSAAERTGDDIVSEPIDGEPEEHSGAVVSEVEGSDPGLGGSRASAGVSSVDGVSDGDTEATHPIQRPVDETPPYDDPTAALIQAASDLHGQGPSSLQSESSQPEVEQNEAQSGQSTESGNLASLSTDSEHARPILTGPETVGLPEQNGTERTATSPSDADASPASTEEPEQPASSGMTSSDPAGREAEQAEASPDHAAHANGEFAGADMATLSHHDDAGKSFDEPHSEDGDDDEHVDQIGGDALGEVPQRSYRSRRQYKIQEVIKRRQVLLVQVVKEERGNKGAALTTYLSLAGRYSVLMPNTARGGGISRKITDSGDRQRLKSIAQELDVPEGMGVILRTAGAARSKPEVKRDFEYLMRMWETVRETTLASTAPKLVYEEGSLIKRAIRDLYNADVEEIVVAGEDGYREAKEFMRLLQPSHARNVQLWRDPAPLFTKAGAEAQLDAMFSSHVTLKSGGYLVINQTEALVAIDVNSGRSTREHNIEDTALRTNLEAADEVARQLRLRDLAGLIVVDFIDMEEGRNNRAVERRIKDALKDDRARIQIGRISHFGLLEMSRQRIRTGVLEGSTEVCQHCGGTGTVRSTASIALHVIRLLEDALVTDASRDLTVATRSAVALYILNHKRLHVDALEGRFGVIVTFTTAESLTGTAYCSIERGEPASGIVRAAAPTAFVETNDFDPIDDPVEDEAEADGSPVAEVPADSDEAIEPRRRRRRRGRGRDRGDTAPDAETTMSEGIIANGEAGDAVTEPAGATDLEEEGSRDEPREEGRGRRRRSRRGGRRSREADASADGVVGGEDASASTHDETAPVSSDVEGLSPSVGGAETSDEAELPLPVPPEQPIGVTLPEPKPTVAPEPTIVASSAAPEVNATEPGTGQTADAEPSRLPRPEPTSSELDPSRPKRSGWWQRAKATLGG